MLGSAAGSVEARSDGGPDGLFRSRVRILAGTLLYVWNSTNRGIRWGTGPAQVTETDSKFTLPMSALPSCLFVHHRYSSGVRRSVRYRDLSLLRVSNQRSLCQVHGYTKV